MAFQAPNAGQSRENRKILEQLEEQKRKLKMAQGGPGAAVASFTPGMSPTTLVPPTQANAASGPLSPGVVPKSVLGLAEPQHMAPAQRTALQHAHSNSVGYYTTQDSSFGNLILPVLPRFNTT